MSEAMSTPRVGLVGLDAMGRSMARHLAAAGYALSAPDLGASVRRRARGGIPGISVPASAGEVGAVSDIVITLLPDGHAVERAIFGEYGIAEGLRRGALLLDASSSEPWLTRRTAARLADLGIEMVDAPASGTLADAQNAELVFMVGGEAAAVARAAPLLSVLGTSHFHVGPIGAGHAMKSIKNLIAAIAFLATTEGLAIGRHYGLDPAAAAAALNASTGIVQPVLTRRFDDPFKLDLVAKDIDIALKIASDAGLEMPLARANQALWHDRYFTTICRNS
jgi:3-hydroxyisobutyrate dehydrogenase-like beta-hydroxyacid dehydrogenase